MTPGSGSGEPPAPTQVSAMPLPPMQYVKMFSEDNRVRGFPQPPPPLPPNEQYRMFGQPFAPAEDQIISSLESNGLRRLYSNKDLDRKKELKKLNQSILVNFLDLLDLLIKAPDSPKRDEKIEDLNLLFINMHHLVNEFRPHQARETLRVMLHVQRKRREQVALRFRDHLDKVQDNITDALGNLPNTDEESDEKPFIPASCNQNEGHLGQNRTMSMPHGVKRPYDDSSRADVLLSQYADDVSSYFDAAASRTNT